MKILALMTDAYGGDGGIAQHNRDLMDALGAMPQVTSIALLPRLVPKKSFVLPEKLVEHDGGKSAARYVAQAMALAVRVRPNLILCGHINLLPLAAAIKRALDVPLAIELHGIEAWAPKTSALYYWCTRQIDLAISVSRFTRRKFLSWSGTSPWNVKVVPNAIHIDRYSPAGKPTYLEDRYGLQGKKVLLTLGRLSASDNYKGQDRIIKLMGGLLEQQPSLVYLIAGDGDDRGRLEKLAIDCGVHDQVRLIGHVPAGEIVDLYNLADAFAMPSTGEGFGYVFLEAAACGVPVLGGNVDGSPDALADGRIGIMVDPDDGKALREGILRLLGRPKAVPDDLAGYDFGYFKRQVSQLMIACAERRS